MTATQKDPWFTRVIELMASIDQDERGPDPELVAGLTSQTLATGNYAPPAAQVSDAEAPGPHGPIPLRIYEPAEPPPDRPMLVWCHGGAWIGGDLDMPEADSTSREVCSRSGAVVVSVDYRLCRNGVHHPIPHDDVVAAFRWAQGHAGAVGVDPRRISLGGASAGANLAAGACLRLRDAGDDLPATLLLVYPALHAQLPEPSPELASKLERLPRLLAFAPEFYEPLVENLLGAPVAQSNPYAMAADGDLRGLPPTLVVNCEFDGLRASGEAFTAALVDAGVEVTQLLAPNVGHGHINAPWLAQAQQTYDDLSRWVRGERGVGHRLV